MKEATVLVSISNEKQQIGFAGKCLEKRTGIRF
jgi:hypothetical protein